MLSLPSRVAIYLYSEPVDMRKSIDGLSALVKARLGYDVYSGNLFTFVSRRRDRLKILGWDHGGFVVYYKRLERGRFRLPAARAGRLSITIDSGALSMLLEGIDFSRVRRPKLWHPPAQNNGPKDREDDQLMI